jgi:hypothetical protein
MAEAISFLLTERSFLEKFQTRFLGRLSPSHPVGKSLAHDFLLPLNSKSKVFFTP